MRQEKFKKNVHCPLVKREIGDLLCEDVSFAAEGVVPIDYAAKEFRIDGWKAICEKCKNHPT